MINLRTVALAAVLALGAASAGAQGMGGVVTSGPGTLPFAFACIGADGISHICLGDLATGAASAPITSGACGDVAPEWSFDGTQIAFERVCPGSGQDIYKINPDGTGLARVTTSTLAVIPTWTPGGQIVYMQIVYQSGFVFCSNSYNVPCTSLRVINTDGTGDAELLASQWEGTGEVSLINISPHVTPDGTEVVFACGPYGSGSWGGPGIQLCAIPFALGSPTQTPTLLSTVTSTLSSDPHVGLLKVGGQYQVVFDSGRNGGNLNIFTMNIDGSAVSQLTTFTEPIEGQDAGYSPDMSKILFEHDSAGGAASIWVMDSKGGNQRNTGIVCSYSGCKPRFKP